MLPSVLCFHVSCVTQAKGGGVRLRWSSRIGAAASGAPELDDTLTAAQLEKVPRPGARILALHCSGRERRFFW
jgi:hypothetical protein